ncbi:MAG: hypothetical protein ABL985_07710 [Casimicrobium sp.]
MKTSSAAVMPLCLAILRESAGGVWVRVGSFLGSGSLFDPSTGSGSPRTDWGPSDPSLRSGRTGFDVFPWLRQAAFWIPGCAENDANMWRRLF